jgi:DNA repair protein RecN (Recombination protein N)
MLSHLSIRNIVLIEALDLAFAPGLGVLTGETGRANRSCSMHWA